MSTQDDTAPAGTTAFEQWEVVELAASAETAPPAADLEAELARLRRLVHPWADRQQRDPHPQQCLRP